MGDRVRVLRIIEYVGPRDWVEGNVSRSIHGTKTFFEGAHIRAVTIGDFPEILERNPPKQEQSALAVKWAIQRQGEQGFEAGPYDDVKEALDYSPLPGKMTYIVQIKEAVETVETVHYRWAPAFGGWIHIDQSQGG